MPKLSVFQTVLLAVFGALAVSGVLIFALVVGGGGNSSIGPVTLWGTFDESAFRVVLRQAAENDERLSQVEYVQKKSETYTADITEALASGAGPDVFFMRQDYAVRDAGKVLPIPYDRFPRSQFQNTFVESANPFLGESGVLGFPILVDPFVLYWNKDMLASAGFANPPKYWDEISAMSQAITKRSDAGQIIKSAVSFGEYRNVNYAKDILSMLMLQAGGSITARDNTTGKLVASILPRGGDTARAAESALRFYTEFADPAKASYSWSRALPESRAAFSSGDLALYIGLASERPIIARINPNLNFAVTAVPQIRDAERLVNVARVYALATTRTTRNAQGAVIVSSILASADISEALGTVYGLPSARRDVLARVTSGEKGLFNQQTIISYAWTDPDPDETNVIFRAMIENVTTGTLRLAEAVSRANKELAQMLDI